MKALQIKLALLLLLFTGVVNAQIVNIPDLLFKQKLLQADIDNATAKDVNGNFIKIDINDDNEIQESEALNVYGLFIGSDNYSNIVGINSFTNLRDLKCSGFGNLLIIDISNLVNLEKFNCSFSWITTINFPLNNSLTYLDCYASEIISLNVSNLTNLLYLNCGLQGLESGVACTLIGLENLENLKTLKISEFNLTTLDVSNNLNLEELDCSGNYLLSLNLNLNTKLTNLKCGHNIVLKALEIKNGVNEVSLSFSENPNLEFICADNSQLVDVQTKINTYGYTNCVLNTYCSFTPGGNYNTISGNIKFDANNDGCDANDLPKPNIRVNINDGTNTGASFTSNTGNYTFFTQAGSFDITPEIENPTFFNFTPAIATIPFVDNNNNTATQDFCISANGVHPDIEVVLVPITPARPGFDATYKLVYRNKGNQTLSGDIILIYNNSVLDLISISQPLELQNGANIQWGFSNLLPFETRSIDITFHVNSPTETPAVNIGDLIVFNIFILPITNDENQNDNTFTLAQTVVGSYDPNDITCLEGNNVAPSEIGEYLHYVINFENTGNYSTENVVVKTIVDTTKFDVNSLQLLNTSNPVDARITGNVVEFIFENIQLDGPGGHGHILLKIKSKNTLVAGDTVAKNANIYFDYNAPVDTGMATTVFQSLSNTVFEKDDSINVSPNPTSGIVSINSNFNIKKVELYDVQGRVLETQIGETKSFDISEKANGIYFLKITTEKGSKVEKVIKE